MTLQRVYLDQWAWIRLARAAYGRPTEPEDADAWAIAQASVAAGLASFPLSVVHYMETLSVRDLDRRRRLGLVMAGLSQFHTIASPVAIVSMEVDRALRSTFGRPRLCRDVQIFGRGFRHALGVGDDFLKFPDWLTPVQRKTIEEQAEAALLLGFPRDDEAWRPLQRPDPFAAQFADRETQLSQHLANVGYHHGEKLTRFLVGDSLAELGDLIEDGLKRARVSADEFYGLGRQGLIEFLRRIHTRHVVHELRRARHAQRQKKWKPNDLQDLAAMSIGVVYSDIVVAEKEWTDAIRRAGLDEAHRTAVIDTLSQLPEALVTTTAA